MARQIRLLSGSPTFVAMVQPADLRQCYDSSHFPGLNQAQFGRVLSQREMGSRSVIRNLRTGLAMIREKVPAEAPRGRKYRGSSQGRTAS